MRSRVLGDQKCTVYGRCTHGLLNNHSVKHSEDGGMIVVAVEVQGMVLDAD